MKSYDLLTNDFLIEPMIKPSKVIRGVYVVNDKEQQVLWSLIYTRDLVRMIIYFGNNTLSVTGKDVGILMCEGCLWTLQIASEIREIRLWYLYIP